VRFVLEALPALALLAGLVYVGRRVLGGWRDRRALARARWRARVRAAENQRVRVEVERLGEATQVVAELDPSADDFDEQLFDAESRAERLAATLNASGR
jgi:hypothetical protein